MRLGGFVFQKVALHSIQAICTHKQIRPCVLAGFFLPGGGASTMKIPFKYVCREISSVLNYNLIKNRTNMRVQRTHTNQLRAPLTTRLGYPKSTQCNFNSCLLLTILAKCKENFSKLQKSNNM